MKTEELKTLIEKTRLRYYQLVLLLGPPGSSKTAVLSAVAKNEGYPYINLSLTLAEKLLGYPVKKRPLYLSRIIDQILGSDANVVLLDNTEVLFDPSLQHDPLRLLQQMSRNRTIVAAWNGRFEDEILRCAERNHPEYKEHSDVDALIHCLGKRDS